MAIENKLNLQITQKIILAPYVQQVIKLLQLSQIELAQTLNQELMENPFLQEQDEDDEDEDEYKIGETEEDNEEDEKIYQDERELLIEDFAKTSVDEYFQERSDDGRDLGYFVPDISEKPSFEQFSYKKEDIYEHLLWQLNISNVKDDIKIIAEFIIGNIDKDGYLKATDEEIIDALNLSDIHPVKEAISLVQSFDPVGIGARNLKECLLLQVKEFDLKGTLIEEIIINNMGDLEKKNYKNISKQYHCSIEDIIKAVKIIEKFQPRPASGFFDSETIYITPDVFIIKINNEYQIMLNEQDIPKIKMNNTYKNLILNKKEFSKEERIFLKDRLRSANELLKGLDQRNKTIYKVSQSILKFQRNFFEQGRKYLKPLDLKDVAVDIKMHESTVSRVTTNKFLSCEYGTYNLKFFFSNSIQSQDGEISSTSVKDFIKKIVVEEDFKKPLSDKMIADSLKKHNINIARRTVTKYREVLNIPSQKLRKKY